jgi:hypothetical protein
MVAAGASADVVASFEAPEYTTGVLSGQNGWYLPPVGGVDFNVYAYGSDPYGMSVNPTGGDQLAIGQYNANHARAQIDNDFSGAAQWEIAYDVNVIYDGSTAATDNIGSASLQDSASAATFIPIMQFNPTDDAWMANMLAYDAAGVQITVTPGPEWADRPFNSWFRQTWVVDFSTNEVLSATITDLTTGDTASVEFADVYLQGGSAGGRPLPTAFRIFSSGSAANITGWDNISVTPVAGDCYADFNDDDVVDTRDVLAFLNAWNGGDASSDCDGNGTIDTRDVLCFLNLWNAGC